MKGKLLLLGFEALAMGLVLGLIRYHAPRTFKYSYDRIHLGMTTAEVGSIVGVPPGDYSSCGFDMSVCWGWKVDKEGNEHTVLWDVDRDCISFATDNPKYVYFKNPKTGRTTGCYTGWIGDECALIVFFNGEGKVVSRTYGAPPPKNNGRWIDRFVNVLKWK